MSKDVFNRHEEKYLLHEETFENLLADLAPRTEYDIYNQNQENYTIYNIYLDTLNDKYIQNSLDKKMFKQKIRIRSYCKWEDTEDVYLEIKKKFAGVVNKRRIRLPYEAALFFIENGTLPTDYKSINPQIKEELAFLLNEERLYPKVKIQYDRLALYSSEKKDLRISFDTNIHSERCNGLQQNLLHPQFYIMEIKTSDSFPLWLCQLLNKYELKSQSFSKYGREYLGYIKTDISYPQIRYANSKIRSLEYGIAI